MSTSDIPQWVKTVCIHWGRAKRRLWRGADWHLTIDGTRHWHVDGYAESFMGHLMEDKMGATQGKRRYQYWPEVFGGDALEVQRALPGIPEAPNDALHVHYVFDPEFGLSVRMKAKLIGLKERAYWEALGRAEFWIFARLDPSAHTQVIDPSQENSRQPLKSTLKPAQNRVHLIKAPVVSLSALNRPKISLKQAR